MATGYEGTTGSATPASAFIRPERNGSRSSTASKKPARLHGAGDLAAIEATGELVSPAHPADVAVVADA